MINTGWVVQAEHFGKCASRHGTQACVGAATCLQSQGAVVNAITSKPVYTPEVLGVNRQPGVLC